MRRHGVAQLQHGRLLRSITGADQPKANTRRQLGCAWSGTVARTTTAACFADSLKVEPDDACAMRHPGIAEDGRRPTDNVTETDPTDARARRQLGIAGGGSRQQIFNLAAASQRH